jgi:hypothetical protein
MAAGELSRRDALGVGVARHLSELIPKEQRVPIRELVLTPFPARHNGHQVTVQAVFERTAIVRRAGREPYQTSVNEVEVNADDVHVRSAAELPRRVSWVRLSGEAASPERIAARRAASDQRARDSRKAIETRPPQRRPRARNRETGIGAAEVTWLREEVDSLASLTAELEPAIGEVRSGVEDLRRHVAASTAVEVDTLAGLTSELAAAIGDVRVGLQGIAALVVAR